MTQRRNPRFKPEFCDLENRSLLGGGGGGTNFSGQVATLVAAVAARTSSPTSAQLQATNVALFAGTSNSHASGAVIVSDTNATTDVTLWAENIVEASETWFLGATAVDFTQTQECTVTDITSSLSGVTYPTGYGGVMSAFWDSDGGGDTTFLPAGPDPNSPTVQTGTWTPKPGSYYSNTLETQEIYGDPWS